METCFFCGVPSNKAKLFDAIAKEGIVKVCEKCASEKQLVIINKPTPLQVEESKKKQNFYQRAALYLNKNEKRISLEKRQQEVNLREIVDRNYEKKALKDSSTRPEMVHNFHWIIMRARRMRKLTQEQLAKEIGEPEAAIKMAEQGLLPEDNYKLVNKIENYLGIKIISPEFKEEILQQSSKELSFDINETKTLTIDDLRKMKEEKDKKAEDERPEFEKERQKEEEHELEKPVSSSKGDVSKEEIDSILFRK